MQRRNLLIFLAVVAVLAAIGLIWENSGSKKADAQRAKNAKIAVTTAEATEVDFPIRRQAIGLIESPASVTVMSRIDSQLLEQHVKDGQLVKQGDLLFVLDDKEIQAAIAKDTATVAKDDALHDQSMADLNRAQELLARNAASRQQLDQATANQKAAAAVMAADKAVLATDNLKLAYTRIYAPISGRIGTVRVTPGNLVKANDVGGGGLVTITQIQPLRVAFALPERDLPLLRSAMLSQKLPMVKITAPNGGAKAEGKLDFIDNVIDANSGTITAKASFANDDLALWPGQYVHVDVELSSIPDAITLPTVSLQIGQEGSYVFVVGAEDKLDIRFVKVLATDHDKTAVSGVKAGERVVVEGRFDQLGQDKVIIDKSVRPAAATVESSGAVQ